MQVSMKAKARLWASSRYFRIGSAQTDATDWFSARCAEHPDGICYYLQDPDTADRLRFLYKGITESDLQHERDHAEKFATKITLGHSSSWEYVAHPLKIIPYTNRDRSEEFERLEWTNEDIQKAKRGEDLATKLSEGHLAASGRFIVNQDFLNEMNSLRDAWTELPANTRPLFPLAVRGLRAFATPPESFVRQFQTFASKWRVQEVLMWHLAILDPVALAPEEDRNAIYESLQANSELPTAFSLSSVAPHSRGRIYRNHRARSEADGIDDHNHVQTYINFLRIHHWKRVLDFRYPTLKRPSDFISRRNSLIASFCHLSEEQIKRLSNKMSQMRRGTSRSLKGTR